MQLDDGTEVDYVVPDNWVLRLDAKEILNGRSYPVQPAVTEVRTVLDVGANYGAASLFLSRTYPTATLHAFEPASEPYGYLERNLAGHPDIHTHRFGLFDRDDTLPLFLGKASAGANSIKASRFTTDEHETITLRRGSVWLADEGIERVDVLKIDTEGCEVPILTDLAPYLPEVQVVYLEFHSVDDRAAIVELLSPTHALVSVRQALDWIGELAFLRHDLVS